ncbi:MarR family transcriptional regulator [Thioclava sp. GXIMD2076]|uniref:MarR family transcriptional regulator n=1 Tax=Thioclava kandeliae TaxID=3070818 RepID=A0ABV1SBL8_9RHOB
MDLAILTGDLVGSTGLPPDLVEAGFSAMTGLQGLGLAWFNRHRGDGWQMALAQPAYDLRLALMVRACLRALDPRLETRIAIARGTGNIPENGDLNRAQGPGFVASGRLLDQMTGAEIRHASGGAWSAATCLADALSHGWTQKQAEAMCPMLALPAPPQQSVADQLGKSRQAVAQALQGAGYSAISGALTLWEAP